MLMRLQTVAAVMAVALVVGAGAVPAGAADGAAEPAWCRRGAHDHGGRAARRA